MVRVCPAETIFPHVHLPHLCLGHGAVGVPATTMRVAHTLKVVTQAKLAAVILQGGVHSPIFRRVNLPLQAKTRCHLQVGPPAKGSGPFPVEGGLSILSPPGRVPVGWCQVLLPHAGWLVEV